MKQLILISIIVATVFPLVANSKNLEGYLVKTILQYKAGGKTVESSGELILARENKAWVTVTSSKEGFIVLGRIVEAKNKTLGMEYIVVNTNEMPNGVISTPKIISKIGQDSSIEVKTEKNAILLKMNAMKTTYVNE